MITSGGARWSERSDAVVESALAANRRAQQAADRWLRTELNEAELEVAALIEARKRLGCR